MPGEAEGGGFDAWADFVSVVIPVRDGVEVIGAQLEALSTQDYAGAWEVVVSDNGSTDDTRAVIERWSEKLPSVRVVDSSDVAGQAHARNVGVDAAKGPFIALCDADDVVTTSWLSALVTASAPGAVVAGPLAYDELNEPMVRSWANQQGISTAAPLSHLGFLPYAVGANTGVDKAVWSALEGWDVSLPPCEDQDFSWRAQLAGFPLMPAHGAVVNYRLRTTMRAMARQAFGYGRGDVRLYATHKEHGLNAPRLRRVLRIYLSIASRLPGALLSRTARGRWCRDAAYRYGRLSGSIRGRVWYP